MAAPVVGPSSSTARTRVRVRTACLVFAATGIAVLSLTSDGGSLGIAGPAGPPHARPPLDANTTLQGFGQAIGRGQSRPALAALGRRFAADPSDTQVVLELVRAGRYAGRLDWVASFLSAVHRRVPTAASYLGLAELRYLFGEQEEARDLARAAYRRLSTSIEAALSWASGLISSGEIPSAFIVLDDSNVGWEPDGMSLSAHQRLSAIAMLVGPEPIGLPVSLRWLRLAEDRGDEAATSRATVLVAAVESVRVRMSAARRAARRALSTAVPSSDSTTVVMALSASADVGAQHGLGLLDSTLGACQALSGAGLPARTDCLVSAIEAAWNAALPGEAIRLYQIAAPLAVTNPILTIRLAGAALPVLNGVGSYRASARLADDGAKAAAKLGSRDVQASFLVRLASAQRALGNYRAAQRTADEAVELTPKGSTQLLIRALVEAAEASIAIGNDADAAQSLARADELLPSATRVEAVGDVGRSLRLRLMLANTGSRASAGAGETGRPLSVVEAATEARRLESTGSMEAALVKYLVALQGFGDLRLEFSNASSRILFTDAWPELSRRAMAIAFATGDWELALALLEGARDWGAETKNLTLKPRLPILGPETAALAFAVGPAAVWAVLERSDRTHVLSLDIAPDVLRSQVMLCRAVSAENGADVEVWRSLCGQLSRSLLGRLEDAGMFTGVRRLLIVPDDALHLVSFASLPREDGRELYGERHLITQSPSLRLLSRSLETKAKAGPFVAFGAAGTAGGLAELAVLRGVSQMVFVGPRATERNLRRVAPGASVIHFGGHSSAATSELAGGALYLRGDDSEDGMLSIPEILEIDVSGSTVVLLGCDTATRPFEARLSGAASTLPSVGEAFLLAGARAVVGHLWPITESDARSWAEAFYAAGGPDGGHASLEQARRELRARWPDEPRRWASAVWLGAPEPRRSPRLLNGYLRRQASPTAGPLGRATWRAQPRHLAT